jgi:AcrR family transcriptional regulator
MSTRRTDKGTKTRARILCAARRLFAANGFNGTTTRQIADAARVNEALIFRHFPTKRRLYGAIIQKKIDEELATRPPVTDAGAADDDRAVFRAIALRLFDSFENDPAFVRLLYFSALEGHALADMFFDSYVHRLNAWVRDYVRRRAAQGEFKNLDPFLVARAFLGMVAHYTLLQELFRLKRQKRFRKETVVDAFVEIFLRGIKR